MWFALAPGVIYGNYDAFRLVFGARFPAFSPLLFVADRGSLTRRFGQGYRSACPVLQSLQYRFASAYAEGTIVRAGARSHEFVLTMRRHLSVAVPLISRFLENWLNGWIGLKQRVA